MPEKGIEKLPIGQEPKALLKTLVDLGIIAGPSVVKSILGARIKGAPEAKVSEVKIPEEKIGPTIPRPVTTEELQVKAPKPEVAPEIEISQPPLNESAQARNILMDTLKKLPPLRKEHKQIIARERALRFRKAEDIGKAEPTLAGYQEQLQALKGKQAQPLFESPQVESWVWDRLMKDIEESPLTFLEKLPAKEGLVKIIDGYLPEPKQMQYLRSVFGPELAGTLLNKRSWFKKAKELGMEGINVFKALMASGDLSFGLRQGVALIGKHPALWGKAWKDQFRLFADPKFYEASQAAIRKSPYFDLMQKGGLGLTEVGPRVPLRMREEPLPRRLGFRGRL